ncbi:MAG: hypothetical protein ACLT98_18165 [Eggerthellaceae bacterium]
MGFRKHVPNWVSALTPTPVFVLWRTSQAPWCYHACCMRPLARPAGARCEESHWRSRACTMLVRRAARRSGLAELPRPVRLPVRGGANLDGRAGGRVTRSSTDAWRALLLAIALVATVKA